MEKKAMYANGQIYDLQNAKNRDDVDFYRTMVKKHGDPVLELACGTGVLTIPIAQDGYKITGLDLSDQMLNQAKRKSEGTVNINFINGDMANFELGKKYKTIFVGFNSVCHLFHYGEIEGMLTSIKNHLDKDGVFIFDCFIPIARYLYRELDARYPVFDDEGLKISETNEYDPVEQVNHIKWYYEYRGNKWIEDLDMRMFYPQEIQNYLGINGLKIVEKYGNHDFSEFGPKSSLQIYVCKKK